MHHPFFDLLVKATLATLGMVFVSAGIAMLFGLSLAILLTITRPQGLWPVPAIGRPLGVMVDLTRAVPFIILLVLLIPLTRFLVGTALGTAAAIVPLSITAIPYFARIAEVSLKDVNPELIEGVRAMGTMRAKVVQIRSAAGSAGWSCLGSDSHAGYADQCLCHGGSGGGGRTW